MCLYCFYVSLPIPNRQQKFLSYELQIFFGCTDLQVI